MSIKRDTENCVKFSMNGYCCGKGGLRNGSHHPQQSLAPLPDEMRFNERLLRVLRALDLQGILQQLGYDVPRRPLFF